MAGHSLGASRERAGGEGKDGQSGQREQQVRKAGGKERSQHALQRILFGPVLSYMIPFNPQVNPPVALSP